MKLCHALLALATVLFLGQQHALAESGSVTGIEVHPSIGRMAAPPPLSPAAAAKLHGALRKAQQRFADRVGSATGVAPGKILAWLPNDWRAGEPRFVLFPKLEAELKMPLSEGQRQFVIQADRDMKAEMSQARSLLSGSN